MSRIIVWCAWCGKYMHSKDGEGQSGDSHGMCHKCYGEEIVKIEETHNANPNKRRLTMQTQCRKCDNKFQVDTREPLPEDFRICPECRVTIFKAEEEN